MTFHLALFQALIHIQWVICEQTSYMNRLSKTTNPDFTNLEARAPNWTTQAWQRNCNNIDHGADNNLCCSSMSGPNWKSCNGVGWTELGGSGVLCYSLEGGHDCCDDDSVCDYGVGCCNGTCCQKSTSITVCRSGCVSLNGLGCSDGECVHGKNKATGSETGTDSIVQQTEVAQEDSNDSPSKTTASSSTTTKESSSSSTSGTHEGYSKSEKIALGVGIGFGIPTALIAIFQGIRWCCG